MVDFLKIKDIISILPLLIIYILPGYSFINVVNFIINKKQVDDKNILIKSLVISYIIINSETLLLHMRSIKLDISSSGGVIFTFCFSIIIAYLYSMIVQGEIGNMILKWLKITRSLKTDILNDLVDFELGMWIKIFLSSEQVIYVGKLRRFELITDTSYSIVLSNFILYNYSGDELVNNSTLDTEWVAVSVKDNYRIELVYMSKSKKIIN